LELRDGRGNPSRAKQAATGAFGEVAPQRAPGGGQVLGEHRRQQLVYFAYRLPDAPAHFEYGDLLVSTKRRPGQAKGAQTADDRPPGVTLDNKYRVETEERADHPRASLSGEENLAAGSGRIGGRGQFVEADSAGA
jgi:hypothetical protein